MSRKGRKNGSDLRRIIRKKFNYTCTSCNNQPCPVVNKCLETTPDDPRLINICSFPVNSLDPEKDRYKAYRKTGCVLQVHHNKMPYSSMKNPTLQEEIEISTLLCRSCHKEHHVDSE